MIMQPLVSVIMPVFNAARFLKPALESILAQTFTDFEFLIVDDHSTDATVAIIKSYQDPRIKLLKNRGKGIASALNTAINESKGIYLARMDGDDIAHPTRIQQQVEYLQQHPECVLVSTNMALVDENNKCINPKIFPSNKFSPPLPWLLLWSTPIAHPAVMLRSDIIKNNQLFYRDVLAEDSDLWRRLAFYGKMHRLDQVLLDYRFLNQSLSQKEPKAMMQATMLQAEHYARALGLEGLNQFMVCSAYGRFAESQALPDYACFREFVTRSIAVCTKQWQFTQAEQKRCYVYADYLYTVTALWLKEYRRLLSCLLFKFKPATWHFLARYYLERVLYKLQKLIR
jgi:glycosyltransferase involved in cell wall biosynthesis